MQGQACKPTIILAVFADLQDPLFRGVQQACKDARVTATLCMQLLAAAAHTNDPLAYTPPQATKGFQPSSSSTMSKSLVARNHQSSKAADFTPQHMLAFGSWEIYQYAVSEKFEFTAAAMTGLCEILTAAGDSHTPTWLLSHLYCEGVASWSLGLA